MQMGGKLSGDTNTQVSIVAMGALQWSLLSLLHALLQLNRTMRSRKKLIVETVLVAHPSREREILLL